MKTYGADADGPNPYKNPPLVATSFDTTRTGWEFLGEYFSAQFLEQVSLIPFEGGGGLGLLVSTSASILITSFQVSFQLLWSKWTNSS